MNCNEDVRHGLLCSLVPVSLAYILSVVRQVDWKREGWQHISRVACTIVPLVQVLREAEVSARMDHPNLVATVSSVLK
jgi:hypothetical protein